MQARGGQQAYLAWRLILLAPIPNGSNNSEVLDDPLGVDRLPGPGFPAVGRVRASLGSEQMQFIETNKPQVRREGLVLLDSGSPHTWDQGEHREGCHKKLPGLGRRILVLARQGLSLSAKKR